VTTDRQAFDKYDAKALVQALEDAFETYGMWDAYSDWQRVKGVILGDWSRRATMGRTGFDKRNVPELLNALEGLLKKNGLNKGLSALNRVKRSITKEWNAVGAEAARLNKRDRKPKPFHHGPDSQEQLGFRGASMSNLRRKIIRLAHENPELRPKLLPLLATKSSKKAANAMALLKGAIDELKNTIKNDRLYEGEMTEEGMASAVEDIALAALNLDYGSEEGKWRQIKSLANHIIDIAG